MYTQLYYIELNFRSCFHVCACARVVIVLVFFIIVVRSYLFYCLVWTQKRFARFSCLKLHHKSKHICSHLWFKSIRYVYLWHLVLCVCMCVWAHVFVCVWKCVLLTRYNYVLTVATKLSSRIPIEESGNSGNGCK